jgi:prepilin-type N-terminal cleavage/methylation domain-containing protein
MMKRTGLTVIEVIVAITIIGVLLAVLTPAIIQSMRQTSRTGQSTQVSQIINYLGRRLVADDSAVKPINTTTPLTWNYGELSTAFNTFNCNGNTCSDLQNDSTKGIGDIDNFKVTITNQGLITWLGATANKYQIKVCFKNGSGEVCRESITISAPPESASSANSGSAAEIN